MYRSYICILNWAVKVIILVPQLYAYIMKDGNEGTTTNPVIEVRHQTMIIHKDVVTPTSSQSITTQNCYSITLS